MLRVSLFSLEQEEEDHSEHGTQQEDRVFLLVDVKGLMGLWNHGDDVLSRQARGHGFSRRVDAVSIVQIPDPSSIPSLTR